jgi:hypothetical protein
MLGGQVALEAVPLKAITAPFREVQCLVDENATSVVSQHATVVKDNNESIERGQPMDGGPAFGHPNTAQASI